MSKTVVLIRRILDTTQLLRYLDECIKNIVDGGVVDAIYLDFAKAFDTVPNRRLLGKVDSYGIRGSRLNWIDAFLIERSQVVKVNNTESKPASVLTGVPQGRDLGPGVFVIYINDLPETVKSDKLLFADDTKIMRTIRTREDVCTLRNDKDSLQHWSQKDSLQHWSQKDSLQHCTERLAQHWSQKWSLQCRQMSPSYDR